MSDYGWLLPPIRSALDDVAPVLLNAVVVIVAYGWLASARMRVAARSERSHHVRAARGSGSAPLSRSRRENRS